MIDTTISRTYAQTLALKSQLLGGKTQFSKGTNPSLQIFDRLGYVQIDTLAVVNRSHHHVLWTRHNDVDEDVIHKMQSVDRSIFEYWGHAMSYLPVSDYRYYLPKMENFKNPSAPWARHQYEKSRKLLKPVLERIREEGPLSARDFKHESRKGGSWWDWKPAKVALEILFWQGDLMITERRNFQKVYDLRERVLPGGTDMRMPSQEEMARFIVRRALTAYGIATESAIHYFLQPGAARDSDMQLVGREEIASALQQMKDSGDVLELRIEDQKDRFYCLKEMQDAFPETAIADETVYILSPFDNLIIQRDRLRRLFDFEYALECYLPAQKRRYGYFVMPVLWKGSFIARLDPKADRKRKILYLKNLVFEPGFKPGENFLQAFSEALGNFARFNGCEEIVMERVEPARFKKPASERIRS